MAEPAAAPGIDPIALAALDAALQAHAQAVPGQAALAADYRAFLRGGSDVFTRAHLAGHFTGSAFVLSVDGEHALLLHHAKLGRWLQPGGHADGDIDLARVALREAEEETGLSGLVVEPAIFDLDRHGIPARGAEPEHWHWDVRYVVRCSGDETPAINSESRAFAWRKISELAVDGSLDPSIRRMAARWLAIGGK
ncbi:MAG TPA: NUDIX hydrolase [Xanthomonadaceae bacterium]|jgi:8-oxo-dGTP pyrophosphatase MutT (NUDIX family)|nr:NUDIX hydrolase [Xanthomonadaceae bacterium]